MQAQNCCFKSTFYILFTNVLFLHEKPEPSLQQTEAKVAGNKILECCSLKQKMVKQQPLWLNQEVAPLTWSLRCGIRIFPSSHLQGIHMAIVTILTKVISQWLHCTNIPKRWSCEFVSANQVVCLGLGS